MFLLHDVFGYDHREVAEIVGKSVANCRQLARRARAHLAADRPRFMINLDKLQQLGPSPTPGPSCGAARQPPDVPVDENMALQSSTHPRRSAARPGESADPVLIGIVSACGLLMLAAGTWALASPSTFADVVGFERAGEHLLQDAGALQLGVGAGLFLALIWRDPLTVVLTGLLIANTAHVVNHATDPHFGSGRADVWLLAVLSLVLAAALLRRLRRGGWVVGSVCAATDPALAPFETQKTVVVATFCRSGAGVATPVSLAVAGDGAVFRTFARSGKAARLRRDPRVLVAPSTARGRVVGPSIPGRARLLDGPEADDAARLLRRKYPVLHGVLVPLAHRLMRSRVGRTVHYEVTAESAPRG